MDQNTCTVVQCIYTDPPKIACPGAYTTNGPFSCMDSPPVRVSVNPSRVHFVQNELHIGRQWNYA